MYSNSIGIYNHFELIILFSLFIAINACNNKSGNKKHDAQKATAEWVSLFNGKNLEGWEVLGGDGDFYVANKTIVGKTKLGVPNSYLATKKKYGNFILTLDFKVDPTLNSGIQIRSSRYPNDTTMTYRSSTPEGLKNVSRHYKRGRVHGYQVEIDPSERAWTGGFYDGGARGWLQPLIGNTQAQNAFEQNKWNSMKIIAEQDHFKTYINGVQAVDVIDTLAKSGFIAVQLHQIHDQKQAGKKILLKHIRIKQLK